MNKKMLWIGILVIVVLGLVVVGRSANRRAAVTPAPETATDGTLANPAEAPGAALSAPSKKLPPKATAKPKSNLAPTTAAPVDIMLDLSNSFARQYQGELELFMKQPADFNQDYIVAEWSCGPDCNIAGVINKHNGRAYPAPADHYGPRRPGSTFVPYTLNSNLYRVVSGDKIETYSFEGTTFTFVSSENF